jgi:hypothetical protein
MTIIIIVLKRFGQFYDMDLALRELLFDNQEALLTLPAPPQRKAKLFNDHMDESFVEQVCYLLCSVSMPLITLTNTYKLTQPSSHLSLYRAYE